jgi:hypothetical protein
MQNDKMMKIPTTIAALALALDAHPLVAAPLKVYLMAGQSNMQGHCKLTTFPYLEPVPWAGVFGENSKSDFSRALAGLSSYERARRSRRMALLDA